MYVLAFLLDGAALVYVAFFSEAGKCLDHTLAQGARWLDRKGIIGHPSHPFSPATPLRYLATNLCSTVVASDSPILVPVLVWRC